MLLKFAAFGRSPHLKHSRASAGFCCPQPWFLWWSENIFPEKNIRLFSRPFLGKKISKFRQKPAKCLIISNRTA